jgi:hypothetical protein
MMTAMLSNEARVGCYSTALQSFLITSPTVGAVRNASLTQYEKPEVKSTNLFCMLVPTMGCKHRYPPQVLEGLDPKGLTRREPPPIACAIARAASWLSAQPAILHMCGAGSYVVSPEAWRCSARRPMCMDSRVPAHMHVYV